jgi:phage-related protein
MTIRDALSFHYAGETSDSYGLYNVNMNSGMLEEPFLAERTIREIKIRGKDEPYFSGIDYSPLQFALSFASKETWNNDKIRAVARWLHQPYYKPLFFTTNIDRIFYCVPVEGPALIHNGLSQGYVNLTMRCDGPYTYSRVYEQIANLSGNTASGTEISIRNLGDVPISPVIEVKIVSGSSFSITNLSNAGIKMEFTGLAVNETLTIDCPNEEIISDLPLTYRYNQMSGDSRMMKLVYGNNRLLVKGNVLVKWIYQYKTLQ